MSLKLNIGVDIDDVVTDFKNDFISFYNRNHHKEINPEEITTWTGINHLPEYQGQSDRVSAAFNYFTQTGGFRNATPIPGAVETLQELQRNHNVYFVSARISRGISDTYRWFVEHGLKIDRMFFDRDKAWHAFRVPLDVFIDDGLHNLDDIARTSLNTIPIVFDGTWNQNNNVYLRAHNWNEVSDHLERIHSDRFEKLFRSGYECYG